MVLEQDSFFVRGLNLATIYKSQIVHFWAAHPSFIPGTPAQFLTLGMFAGAKTACLNATHARLREKRREEKRVYRQRYRTHALCIQGEDFTD